MLALGAEPGADAGDGPRHDDQSGGRKQPFKIPPDSGDWLAEYVEQVTRRLFCPHPHHQSSGEKGDKDGHEEEGHTRGRRGGPAVGAGPQRTRVSESGTAPFAPLATKPRRRAVTAMATPQIVALGVTMRKTRPQVPPRNRLARPVARSGSRLLRRRARPAKRMAVPAAMVTEDGDGQKGAGVVGW